MSHNYDHNEGNLANQKKFGETFKFPLASRQATFSKKERLNDQCAPPLNIGKAIEKLDNIKKNCCWR